MEALKKYWLYLDLVRIEPVDLLYIDKLPCDLFTFQDEEYNKILPRGHSLTTNTIRDLLSNEQNNLYVVRSEFQKMVDLRRDIFRKSARSLSVGDYLHNLRKHVYLTALNMKQLYDYPDDDETLSLHIQATKNLFQALRRNPNFIPPLYHDLLTLHIDYIYKQPLLSSLLLLEFISKHSFFSEKEAESLFIASSLKDIGMSSIPKSFLEKPKLNTREKAIISNHSEASTFILQGRTPLSTNYLNIIRSHHSIGESSSIIRPVHDDLYLGIETVLVGAMDTITAMTQNRPYRDAYSLFDSLNIVRVQMAAQYPQEFKLLIHFFKKYFK